MTGLTRAQLYAALYQMSERVELTPPRGKLGWSGGLRGVFDCEKCPMSRKLELGHCPDIEQAQDGTDITLIDTVGIPSHDEIRCCPKAIQRTEPHAQRDIELFHTIEKLGGPVAWYPAPLSMQDTLTLETYTLLKAIQSRFVAQVQTMRRELDRRKPA